MFTRFVLLGAVCVAAVSTFGFSWGDRFHALEYDGVRAFNVGEHRVSIETKSCATGDNGAAELIIHCLAIRTRLPSCFDADLYNDTHPAYVSSEDMDDDWCKDLVIWRPCSLGGLERSEFISKMDGQLQATKDLRHQPLPSGFAVW